jgi:hypothetical protein
MIDVNLLSSLRAVGVVECTFGLGGEHLVSVRFSPARESNAHIEDPVIEPSKPSKKDYTKAEQEVAQADLELSLIKARDELLFGKEFHSVPPPVRVTNMASPDIDDDKE